jgi:DNA-directed RNA polymerase specialized sigma24 family protein
MNMVDHPMDTPRPKDGKAFTFPGEIPTEWISPVSLLSNPLDSEMSLPVLATLCVRELNTYRRGEPYTDTSSIELLRRATVQGDQEAWAWVQYCFGGLMLDWLRRHPKRAHACRLASDEHYVAQAFERFWQAIVSNQRAEYTTLSVALYYLRACLHSAILDVLRADTRPRESSRLVPEEPGEAQKEDVTSSNEVWEMLKALLSNPREQRLVYLLFHCGLSPREIVQCCPQEWSDVLEIAQLRRTILERLLEAWPRFIGQIPVLAWDEKRDVLRAL